MVNDLSTLPGTLTYPRPFKTLRKAHSMAKTHDRTRTSEAKQETLRRRKARTARLIESRATDRAIQMIAKSL